MFSEDGRRLRRSTAGPGLYVSVADGTGRPVRAPGLAGWVARAAPRGARGAVTIALVSDRRVRVLNRQYRSTGRVTDVLSFPMPTGQRRHPGFLGDVVIATGVARRQARDAGHSLATEYRILALHGLLHLLGYDHERDNGRMSRLERTLRRRAGLGQGLIERAAVHPGTRDTEERKHVGQVRSRKTHAG